jgi:hypothetical protein
LYESIAARYYDKVTLDKLTMDTFYKAKQLSDRDLAGDKMVVGMDMFRTCLWANAIGFLADFSVQQAILCWGYYRYIQERRKRLKAKSSSSATTTTTTTIKAAKDDEEGLDGAILTTMLKKSTHLFVSRSFGLVCSSAGGAVGTLFLPGWGTLLVSSMGDGAASMILDDKS